MDPKNAEPLYYAIIRLFADGCERTSENVLAELEPTYGSRKLFTLKGIDEALATARENGLLEENLLRNKRIRRSRGRLHDCRIRKGSRREVLIGLVGEQDEPVCASA